MENFDDFENKSYSSAKRIKYRPVDKARFYLNIFTKFFQITTFLLLDLALNIFKFFFADETKNISGQNALVTGLSCQQNITVS